MTVPSEVIPQIWASVPAFARGVLVLMLAGVVAYGLYLVGRAVWRKATMATTSVSGLIRNVDRDALRDTAAPVILATAILLLAFEGLVEFAEDQMGTPVPLSWIVIVAFEFTALWFAWVRFARAQHGKGESPFAAVMTWAIIALACTFQYSHAETAELDFGGTVGRTVLPALLGVVVEFALHVRRKAAREADDRQRRRTLDSALRANLGEYIAVRRVLAANPEWTADQALSRVRTQKAGRTLRRLRLMLVQEPTVSPEPIGNGKVALWRHGTALRDHKRWTRQVDRLRREAIRRMDVLGFAGAPTDDSAADLMRDMQVRTRVDEVASLDYGTPTEAVRLLDTLITPDMVRRLGSGMGEHPYEISASMDAHMGATPADMGTEMPEPTHDGDATHTRPTPEWVTAGERPTLPILPLSITHTSNAVMQYSSTAVTHDGSDSGSGSGSDGGPDDDPGGGGGEIPADPRDLVMATIAEQVGEPDHLATARDQDRDALYRHRGDTKAVRAEQRASGRKVTPELYRTAARWRKDVTAALLAIHEDSETVLSTLEELGIEVKPDMLSVLEEWQADRGTVTLLRPVK